MHEANAVSCPCSDAFSSHKIRCVMIVEAAGGGVGKYIHDLVCGLDTSLFDITVVYGTSRMDEQYRAGLEEMRSCATLIPCDELVRNIDVRMDWQALQKIRRIIRRLQPDIVHCHSSKAGVIGRIAAKLEGVPAVYSPHGWAMQNVDFSKSKKDIFAGIEALLSHFATAITINVSPTEKQCALDWHINNEKHFVVIANGVDPSAMLSREAARARLGLSENAIVVGTAIRLTAQKDPLQIINIFALAYQENPLLHLAIVGEGELRDAVSQAIKAHGIEQAVTCYGYRVDASQLFAAFDVVIMASTAEGLPYTLLEAEAAGEPIVATDVEGIKDIVKRGVTGELFPFGDLERGRVALLTVISHVQNRRDSDDIEKINEPYSYHVIQEDFQQRFSLHRMIEKYTNVYKQCARRQIRHA